METIRKRAVLEAVLLDVLAPHEEGLHIHDAYDFVDSRYRFPEEWYRQIPSAQGYDYLKDHGLGDWRDIGQERLVELVPTEPQWQNEMRWARNELRKKGLLDSSAPRGVWRLTQKGRKAAGSSIEELTEDERIMLEPHAGRQRSGANPGVGRRAELTRRLENLTSSMSLSGLDLLVELARVVRRRELA